MSTEKSTLYQGCSVFQACIPTFQRSQGSRPKPWASFENHYRATEYPRERKNTSTALLDPLPMALVAGPKLSSTSERVYTATPPLSGELNRYLPTPSSAVIPSIGVYSNVLGQWVPPKYVSSQQCPVEVTEVPLRKTLSESEQDITCARPQASEITPEGREQRISEQQQVITSAPEPAFPTKESKTNKKAHPFVSRIPVPTTRLQRSAPESNKEERNLKRPRREVEIKDTRACSKRTQAHSRSKGNETKPLRRWK